ncbi:MAG: hypothetical protein JXB46_04130, partial [Candidatus Eisenbacteria bacterium]|nr:hypothetical protein [Candidatus Eisenbacteria bacterium]
PHGRVLARTAVFERGFLVDAVPVVSEETFYARRGDLFPWAMVVAGALMVAIGVHSLPRRGLHRARRP